MRSGSGQCRLCAMHEAAPVSRYLGSAAIGALRIVCAAADVGFCCHFLAVLVKGSASGFRACCFDCRPPPLACRKRKWLGGYGAQPGGCTQCYSLSLAPSLPFMHPAAQGWEIRQQRVSRRQSVIASLQLQVSPQLFTARQTLSRDQPPWHDGSPSTAAPWTRLVESRFRTTA